MSKPLEREQARVLRAGGMSVKDIARQLGVSKSSISVWVRDIPLSDAQQAALQEKHRQYEATLKGSQANREKGLRQRLTFQQEGRARAREGDTLHLAGCMLYWAEGAKDRTSLRIVNSDPDMLAFFCRFLREALSVPDEKMTVRVICYTNNGISVDEIETYWLTLLGLPRECLRRTIVNQQPKSSRQRGRKLMYGVCVLYVHSTHLVQHFYGAIQEYAGIDKPAWIL